MRRRGFLATAGALSVLDPAYLAAKERLAAGKATRRPLPKRQYGRTKEKLSIIGFGGMMVMDVSPKEAAKLRLRFVSCIPDLETCATMLTRGEHRQ